MGSRRGPGRKANRAQWRDAGLKNLCPVRGPEEHQAELLQGQVAHQRSSRTVGRGRYHDASWHYYIETLGHGVWPLSLDVVWPQEAPLSRGICSWLCGFDAIRVCESESEAGRCVRGLRGSWTRMSGATGLWPLGYVHMVHASFVCQGSSTKETKDWVSPGLAKPADGFSDRQVGWTRSRTWNSMGRSR